MCFVGFFRKERKQISGFFIKEKQKEGDNFQRSETPIQDETMSFDLISIPNNCDS